MSEITDPEFIEDLKSMTPDQIKQIKEAITTHQLFFYLTSNDELKEFIPEANGYFQVKISKEDTQTLSLILASNLFFGEKKAS